jgi:hypothetical protein
MDILKAVGLSLSILVALVTFLGSIYGYFFKVKSNCRAIKRNENSIKETSNEVSEIKEKKLPYLVSFTHLKEHCDKQKEECFRDSTRSEKRIMDLILEVKETLISRLDTMDAERTISRRIQSEQREARLVEFTEVKTQVQMLNAQFEKIEEKLV